MIATGVDVLAALAPPDAHVLDLGGGTGALSWALLAGLPGARVTVLDVDPDMLAEARQRLANFGDRVSFQQAIVRATRGGGRVEAIVQTAAAGRLRSGEIETPGRGRHTGTALLLSGPGPLAERGGFQLAVTP